MFLNIFLVLATLWIAWHAFTWSGQWGFNACMKTIHILLAVYGIIVVCKLVIHV